MKSPGIYLKHGMYWFACSILTQFSSSALFPEFGQYFSHESEYIEVINATRQFLKTIDYNEVYRKKQKMSKKSVFVQNIAIFDGFLTMIKEKRKMNLYKIELIL